MTCLQNHEMGADVLVEYLEGTLDAARRAEWDAHAAQCADCRGLLAVRATLDDVLTPPETQQDLLSDFDARLYARIAADQVARPQSWWRRWMPQNVWSAVLPGSALAAIFALVFLLRGPAGSPVTPAERGASETSMAQKQTSQGSETLKQASLDHEIEQLEKELEDLELLMPLNVVNNSL